jgi:putative component of toxin-antitoxin plasmid stabilization module
MRLPVVTSLIVCNFVTYKLQLGMDIKQTETYRKWEQKLLLQLVYFQKRKNEIILLLCGGDKSTQNQDIATAKKLAKELEDEYGRENL